MPFYRVVVRQDAWIKHEGYVQADTADQAAELGLAAWKGKNTLAVPLRPTGDSEGFDAAICEPDDCEEIEPEEFQGEVEVHTRKWSATSKWITASAGKFPEAAPSLPSEPNKKQEKPKSPQKGSRYSPTKGLEEVVQQPE